MRTLAITIAFLLAKTAVAIGGEAYLPPQPLADTKQPAWVAQHPVLADAYAGVGSAPLTATDPAAEATQAALLDLAAQIATRVEGSSFMHTVDVDGKARELFEEKVRQSMTAWIEGQTLVDSYTDSRKYYVYYRLDKKTYEANAASRRDRAVTTGMDYLRQGRAAEAAANLAAAVDLYGKGLEAVTPWMFMDLTTTDGGRRIDVATELYAALAGVFGGMAITTNVTTVAGEAFRAVATPVAGCLSRRGTVVANIPLRMAFAVGAGTVTPAVATDHTGTAEFYVTNVTSKLAVQELRISIDDAFIARLPEAYRALASAATWPEAKVTLTLAAAPATAYIYVDKDELAACRRQVASLLANNHFTVIEDPDAARCFVELSTTLDVGGVVAGEMYDLNECHCGLSLKVYDNQTSALLLDYAAEGVKVLVPASRTAEQTEAQCAREVMKRVGRELPKKLQAIAL